MPDHELTAMIGSLMKRAYSSSKWEAEFRAFRDAARMPRDKDRPRMSASEYAIVATWFEKGLPRIDDLLPETGRPTSCGSENQ